MLTSICLDPPPYLLLLRDHLRASEPGRWSWFASDNFAEEYAEAVRLQLLQSTYRLEEEGNAALYAIARKAMSALELDIPITFYQAQNVAGLNAGLCFLPGEAHLVLQGPVREALDEDELTSLIGHELAHHRLWTLDGGSLRVANEVMESIAGHEGAQPSHVATAVRARRYIELYADRGSLRACGSPRPVVSCLLKVQTGLGMVDPDAFMRQAEEVFAKKALSSRGEVHPEAFIRARAIAKWHEHGPASEPEVQAMVQGPTSMDSLDLLDQIVLTERTRELLTAVIEPPWFRTEPVLAHARSFFADALTPPARVPAAPLTLHGVHASVAEYAAYILLDFAAVDESLGHVGLSHVCLLAHKLGIADSFDRVAREELKLTKKSLEETRKKAPELIAQAEAQHVAAENVRSEEVA